MKIIKSQILLLFFIILSSCNEYIGTIEENYEPTNNVSEIFIKNTSYNEIENISISKIIHPISINEDNILNFENIHKVHSVKRNTNIIFFDNKYYFNLKNTLFRLDFNGNKIKIKIDLDKDEKIIFLFEYKKNIYFLTDNSKLFKLKNESYELISDYDFFISHNPIIIEDKILLFTVFGEIVEINLNNNSSLNKGSFVINYGIVDKYKFYETNETIFYLFNSGTLLTLDKNNNRIKDNYYLEDLNILTNVGTFSELLDTPFSHNDYFYFMITWR